MERVRLIQQPHAVRAECTRARDGSAMACRRRCGVGVVDAIDALSKAYEPASCERLANRECREACLSEGGRSANSAGGCDHGLECHAAIVRARAGARDGAASLEGETGRGSSCGGAPPHQMSNEFGRHAVSMPMTGLRRQSVRRLVGQWGPETDTPEGDGRRRGRNQGPKAEPGSRGGTRASRRGRRLRRSGTAARC